MLFFLNDLKKVSNRKTLMRCGICEIETSNDENFDFT